jgi:heme exporter protein D
VSWGGLNEFLAMGGYGLYVWGSYGMAVLCVVVEVLLLKSRK